MSEEPKYQTGKGVYIFTLILAVVLSVYYWGILFGVSSYVLDYQEKRFMISLGDGDSLEMTQAHDYGVGRDGQYIPLHSNNVDYFAEYELSYYEKDKVLGVTEYLYSEGGEGVSTLVEDQPNVISFRRDVVLNADDGIEKHFGQIVLNGEFDVSENGRVVAFSTCKTNIDSNDHAIFITYDGEKVIQYHKLITASDRDVGRVEFDLTFTMSCDNGS